MNAAKSETAVQTNEVKVSIIIPVYNVEAYVKECLESVINQSLKETEIICINDGSTDNSLSILKEYSEKDSRIIVRSRDNKGIGATRNEGLSVARGRYVCFLDSDDMLDKDALESLYEAAEKEELDVVLFEGKSFYESKELEERFPQYNGDHYHRKNQYNDILSGEDMYVALTKNWDFIVPVAMKFFSRDFLENNSILFPENIYHEDEYFSIKAVVTAKRVKVLSNPFFHRRIRENSIMTEEDNGYERYSGYHETACLVADMLAQGGLKEETVKALAFRVYWFFSCADKIYNSLDDEAKLRAEKDASLRRADYSFLLPVLALHKTGFFDRRESILSQKLAEEKAKNRELKKTVAKHEKRLKAINEGAIVLRMDKRVVKILKGIKRRLKKLFGK